MEYREFGRGQPRLSEIGLGTEYLLRTSHADTEATIAAAIDGGVTYFDLFYAQPEFRDRMGAVFAPYRHRILLAAHFGAGVRNGQYERTRDPDRCEAYFLDFLTRYRTDYVDVLFCHNCDDQDDLDSMLAQGGLCDRIEAHKLDGRVRLIGFSGHTAPTAMRAVASGRFELLMYPVNITNHKSAEDRELFSFCEARDVPIVAMKPYAGGKLVGQDMSASYEERIASPGRAAAGDLAVKCLAFALSRPAVVSVVPGCASAAHVRDALAYVSADAALRDFSQLLSAESGTSAGECTYCNHCLPCPSGIDIGSVMRFHDTHENDLRGAPEAVEECIRCGVCTERCPFGVDVVPRMEAMQAARGAA